MTTVMLSKTEIEDGWKYGALRAEENKGYPDKPGSLKKGSLHTTVQSDALGIWAEIAVCKFLGLDYTDPSIYTPFVKKVNGKYPAGTTDKADIAGIWEVKRREKPSTIVYFKKDLVAKYIVQAVVRYSEDEAFNFAGEVELTGWTVPKDSKFLWRRDWNYFETAMVMPMEDLPMPGVVLV